MDKIQLVSAMSKKLDKSLNFGDIQNFLDAILDSITEELLKEEKVKIVDFGSFEVVERAPRKGFNPHTRTEVIIPACKEPIFKAGKELKQIIKDS